MEAFNEQPKRNPARPPCASSASTLRHGAAGWPQAERMAGDWIKMRTDLYRDPKISLMADSLLEPDGPLATFVHLNRESVMTVTRNVTRNAAVGALLSVWGMARQRGWRDGDDLRIENATVAVVDDICDLPGFGAAILAAGWLFEDGKDLVFPRFFTKHNVEPCAGDKEKNRLRQQRFREAKRNAVTGVTRNVISNDRVEKSRVESKENPKEDSLSLREGESEPPPKKPVKPHRTNDKQAEADALELYEAYPIHEGRAHALKAIRRALKKCPMEELLPKVVAFYDSEYVQSKLGTPDKQFIKRAATWFNGECWDDETGGKSRGEEWLKE